MDNQGPSGIYENLQDELREPGRKDSRGHRHGVGTKVCVCALRAIREKSILIK